METRNANWNWGTCKKNFWTPMLKTFCEWTYRWTNFWKPENVSLHRDFLTFFEYSWVQTISEGGLLSTRHFRVTSSPSSPFTSSGSSLNVGLSVRFHMNFSLHSFFTSTQKSCQLNEQSLPSVQRILNTINLTQSPGVGVKQIHIKDEWVKNKCFSPQSIYTYT